jgi:hypothetical protein
MRITFTLDWSHAANIEGGPAMNIATHILPHRKIPLRHRSLHRPESAKRFSDFTVEIESELDKRTKGGASRREK